MPPGPLPCGPVAATDRLARPNRVGEPPPRPAKSHRSARAPSPLRPFRRERPPGQGGRPHSAPAQRGRDRAARTPTSLRCPTAHARHAQVVLLLPVGTARHGVWGPLRRAIARPRPSSDATTGVYFVTTTAPTDH